MRKMLNTLFVLTEDSYLTLDGENVVVRQGEAEKGRFPLHTLEGICTFAYPGASPALMGACCERGINLRFHSPRGRFLARVSGTSNGNVLLRRTQYRVADDPDRRVLFARNMILGKVYNGRWAVHRTLRDHGMRLDREKLEAVCETMRACQESIAQAPDDDTLRGLEGVAAAAYFSVLDDRILGDKNTFYFHGRSRRPPMDPMNALLSFAYSLLASDCTAALESVGLDAYVGFLHTDRPGRASLALDLMEELRPCLADRFVLSLVNNRKLNPKDFHFEESGSVLLTDEARRKFLRAWQENKQETLTHPYLQEKIPWGLVPYVQALLLARCLRGDLDGYPPFLWK